MFTQSFMVEGLAHDHRNDLVKMADAHRRVQQVKKQRVQASLTRLLAALAKLLLLECTSQLADQILCANAAAKAATKRYRKV